MGRARNLFDLALAIGAIAGSFAVLSPQMLWGDTHMQQITSAQAVSPQKELPLAPFVGIAQFVKTPSDYNIVVDQQDAKVTGAALTGDRLEIDYVKPAGSKKSTGKLIGTLNSEGVFTEAHQSAAKGEKVERASFTFEADGTAKSVKGDRAQATRIFR